jgi:hypothetical protein
MDEIIFYAEFNDIIVHVTDKHQTATLTQCRTINWKAVLEAEYGNVSKNKTIQGQTKIVESPQYRITEGKDKLTSQALVKR